MKIKSKLIISFCIIIFVPLVLAAMVVVAFCNAQVNAIRQTYGIRNADAYSIVNSVQMLNHYTATEFDELKRVASQEPGQLRRQAYQEAMNEELKGKYSYLVVRADEEIVYNGEKDNSRVVNSLPAYGTTESDSGTGIYIDSGAGILVKQVDVPEGEEKLSAFIITTVGNTVPEVKRLLLQVVLAVILILLLTAFMMIIWIYGSMITPIKKLQAAAENIKEGNLDFEIEMSRDDAIGELCVSFEEMRKRLKANAEEKLSNETENKALISNIAHDLKTPITAVKGYAEGIIDGVANTPEKLDKYIRTIYSKANEMDALINELTLYSKIDTNRIPYNYAKLNVSEYFQDCVEEIGLDLEAKGIGFSYYNYVEGDVMIIADPEQLRRVVNNIIGNSVKYMNKQQGFIQIRIKDVGDFIQMELEDNGRGIAQKDLPYIFDRFYRTDASRNSATGGSGIGLSIVKKIVEDHGGKIWATSKEDAGTIMYFVIRKYEEVINE
ncbi:MAG: HAMP domain-containing histidine kinase [Blautia sp.]|nr:HAMP domain-containing histidine kinase [Blautia sp.]